MEKMFYLWGWVGMWHKRTHSSVAHDINKNIMVYVIFVFLALLIIALVYGFIKNVGIDVVFEINQFSSPYHHLGISFFGEDDDRGYLAEKLVIGLVFINVIIVFYKHHDEI
jgi:hypothetical protein